MALSTADALFSTTSVAPVAPGQAGSVAAGPGLPAVVGGGARAEYLRECYAEFYLDNETALEIYNFHAHPDVERLREEYMRIEITWVQATIQQVYLHAADDYQSFQFRTIRFGPAPIDLATSSQSAYARRGLSKTARLAVASTSCPVPTTVVQRWGNAGSAWPPGIMLELNAEKQWASYVGFALGSPDFDVHVRARARQPAVEQVGQPGDKNYKAAREEVPAREESVPFNILKCHLQFEVHCLGMRF